MKGISYITDDQNRKIAAVIDLKKYGELWEDFYDGLVAEQRKHEPKIPLSKLVDDLKRKKKI